MTEYVYKGFKVSYKIKCSENKPKLYKADGYVQCSLATTGSVFSQKFHTEHPSKEGAQNEIKKLLEDYIDFEWQEFHEMHE